MNPRLRIKLLAFIGLAFFTFLNTSTFAQGRGGGGGGGQRGGGQNADPTEIYIKQLKLEGKSKGAFRKAFNKNQRNQEKWRASGQKFGKKYAKYRGQSNIDPAVINEMKAERAELDATQKANAEAYKKELSAFLTPKQITQVDQIAKRVAENRQKQRERRAANQGGGQRGNR